MGASPDELRARYRPADVRVLFIGESPPVGGTFFYAANSKLYAATRRAVEAAVPELVHDPFLESFAALGCYLDDLCLEAVNHLKLTVSSERRERLQLRIAGEPTLAERMSEMKPDAVILMMSGIRENVRRAMKVAGVDAPTTVLPFPGRPEHARRFDHDLRAALGALKSTGVLRRPS
jgi:hypothetical protein